MVIKVMRFGRDAAYLHFPLAMIIACDGSVQMIRI
jgi:hypothetical protein